MSRWIEKWEVYGGGYAGDRKVYTVARDADDNFGCSCAAWKFQKGAKSDCKHISEKKEALLTGKLSEVSGEIMHYYTYALICFLKELQKIKLPANKRITNITLSLSEVPASRTDLFPIGVSLSSDTKKMSINMAAICGAGTTVQSLVDTLTNRLAFYQHAGNQFADFDYNYQGRIVTQAVTGTQIFPVYNFLTSLDGAHLATACLRPLLDGIKELLTYLPETRRNFLRSEEKNKFYIAWPERLTPKIFKGDNLVTSAADLIKPENIESITEAFHSLLLKDYGQEYAALLMEDKMNSQPEPLTRNFY